jgi:hypothetical protein
MYLRWNDKHFFKWHLKHSKHSIMLILTSNVLKWLVYFLSRCFNIQMTQFWLFQTLNMFSALNTLNHSIHILIYILSNLSFSISIVSIHFILITPFQFPMNLFAFKCCVFITINSHYIFCIKMNTFSFKISLCYFQSLKLYFASYKWMHFL